MPTKNWLVYQLSSGNAKGCVSSAICHLLFLFLRQRVWLCELSEQICTHCICKLPKELTRRVMFWLSWLEIYFSSCEILKRFVGKKKRREEQQGCRGTVFPVLCYHNLTCKKIVYHLSESCSKKCIVLQLVFHYHWSRSAIRELYVWLYLWFYFILFWFDLIWFFSFCFFYFKVLPWSWFNSVLLSNKKMQNLGTLHYKVQKL